MKEIAEMEGVLNSRSKLLNIIIKELKEVAERYGQDRKTEIISAAEEGGEDEPIELDTSPVTLFFTKDGYFKKITPQSLRMSGEPKAERGGRNNANGRVHQCRGAFVLQ